MSVVVWESLKLEPVSAAYMHIVTICCVHLQFTDMACIVCVVAYCAES